MTYAAAYIDALGRTVAVADYGTNGGTALTRSATIPARSDTCLVSSMTYDAVGNQTSSTDPAGLVIETIYDALGRETQRTQNPVALNSSSSSSGNTCTPCDDTNVVVQTAYNADGQVSTITAVNANTGNQVTQYPYGTTLTDSAIASSLLKIAEVYPDSVDSDDRVKFTYNRQGEIVTKTDQNATVHAFDFDKLGRRTQDRVTTLGTGVDAAVRRVATTFEVRGMAQNITSYDNATVGSGAIVNDVQIAYNSFGQVTTDHQSHSGTVNVVSTPKVQYTYASGSANTIRPLTAVYPNGRALNYSYGTANGANDVLSRVAALVDSDGTTQLAGYQYLGLGSFVEVDYTQPDIKYTLIDLTNTNDPDTGDIYSGIDRFGRVKDCRWYNYGTSTDTARIKHGYDRAGNRLYREDPVAAINGKAFDELYAYDAINRLRDMQRGTLTSAKTGITTGTRTFEQCWTLDPTGNWKGFREDADGNGTWDLVQSRSDNKVNEITAISNSVGPTWAAPAYNRAGNMTSVPQPADPTKAYTATYYAWNRLVKLVDTPTSQTVQENSYDGRTFRALRKTYTAGVLSETRHMYYSTAWQVLEERLGTSSVAERQFTWGLRYIDDLIVRDRDSNNSGTLNERLYATQDANWNVIAIANATGVVQERYAYSAYGRTTFLTALFMPTAGSTCDWTECYCSYRFDVSVQLSVVRYRSLSPETGVWLQRDPSDDFNSRSFYMYVNSRPLSAQDPMGLFSLDDIDNFIKDMTHQGLGYCGSKDFQIPLPYGFSLHVTFTGCVEVTPCCDHGNRRKILRLVGQAEGYAAWGVKFGVNWKEEPGPKGRRNERVPDPWNPGKKIKRKHLPTRRPAEPGFRERNFHADAGRGLSPCPAKLPDYDIYGTAFFRGTAGAYVGVQFNFYKQIQSWADVKDPFGSWSFQGSVAMGIVGISVEAGMGLNFDIFVVDLPVDPNERLCE